MISSVRTGPLPRFVTLPRLILLGLILANFIYFGLYASRRHLAFETGAFDLGVYSQPLWNFIQGRGFTSSLIEDNGPTRWATHVEPVLFLIAPLYRLWPDPRTLLWLQVAALSLAAWPLYGLAARRLGREGGAVVIVLAYFLLPATEAVTLFDFHAVTLAPLFLLSALFFLDKALTAQGTTLWLHKQARQPGHGQDGETPATNLQHLSSTSHPQPPAPSPHSLFPYLLSALFFLLALSTKEDISLYVFMIGLYLLGLRRRLWEGVALMVVGLAWFYIAFQVIIPAFRTGGGQSIYTAWFETLGNTPLEIALSPFTQPSKVLALVFRPGNLPAVGMLTLPLAFLPLFGLPFFVLAGPGLAFSLLSPNPTLRQFETWHYAAPMLPFILLATVDGLARLSYYLSRLPFFASRSSAPALRPPLYRSSLPILTILLLLTSLIYHHLRGYSHLSQLPEWPQVDPHHRLGQRVAAKIPAEASLLAQAELVPHVAHRRELAIWNGPLSTEYDYIWLDLSHPKLPNRFNAHSELLTGMVIEPAFGPVVARDGYLLLQKGVERLPLSEELFTFTQFDQLPPDVEPYQADFGDTLQLIGVKPDLPRLATSETEPQVTLFFEARQAPAQDYYLFLYLLDQNGQIAGATDYPQPALFWWPTSRWERGDLRQVRVNTIPWWTGDQPRFGYALGLSLSNDPWDLPARLPVTLPDKGSLNPPGSQPLDHGTLLPIAAFGRFGGLAYPKPLTSLQKAGSRG